MKRTALLLATLLSVAASADEAPISARTDAPTMAENGGGVLLLDSRDGYDARVQRMGEQLKVVPISKLPESLSGNALFGFGFTYFGRNRSYVVDGDDASGFVLYLDRNADGDLSNDTPLRFEKMEGLGLALTLSEQVKEVLDGKDHSRQVDVRVRLESAQLPGQDRVKRLLLLQSDAYRAGTLTIGDRHVRFVLHGDAGIYDSEYNTLAFDMDGDGTADCGPQSAEKYEVPERYVNLAGNGFRFEVDHYGDRLTLIPLAEKRPDRPALSPGNPAPDFQFTDTAGARSSLSAYRGKVVLVEFWGLWCAPCVAETPTLVNLYTKYHDRGFEILGVHNGAMADELKAFTEKHKMPWRQVIEDDKGGAITKLYRVRGWPTYYVVGRDGAIVANSVRPSEALGALLEKSLGPATGNKFGHAER